MINAPQNNVSDFFDNLQNGEKKNFIPHDVRSVFPVPQSLPPLEESIERIQIEQYLEKTDDVYQMNLVSQEGALDDLSYILKLDDPNLKGIAWACLGSIHSFNGNYSKSFTAFDEALVQPVDDDVKSYIFMQLSNLLRQLGYLSEAISVLNTSLTMAKNEQLIWRARTYLGYCHKFEKPNYSLSLLNSAVEYYRRIGNSARSGAILRHIGQVYIHLEDYKTAEQYFDEALTVQTDQPLHQLKVNVMNDRGWMLIQQKKYGKARKIFEKLIQKDLSPYQMSLALQNLGYLEYERQNYHEAIKFHSQSFQLTTHYEIREMVFEDCYRLGLCHEKMGEMALADHFYSLGYEAVIDEILLGLPIIGYRQKLLQAYVAFLRNNRKIPYVDMQDERFGFTVDKKMKEIRNIFHKSLLTLHLGRTKNAPQLCEKLKIDTRTYFLYQKKFGLKRGEPQKGIPDNLFLIEYLESLAPLSWREANRAFESDLYDYLLGKYQYNKKKLAEVLDVSYQQVVQKTQKTR